VHTNIFSVAFSGEVVKAYSIVNLLQFNVAIASASILRSDNKMLNASADWLIIARINFKLSYRELGCTKQRRLTIQVLEVDQR
jgi:hypothetical protein